MLLISLRFNLKNRVEAHKKKKEKKKKRKKRKKKRGLAFGQGVHPHPGKKDKKEEKKKWEKKEGGKRKIFVGALAPSSEKKNSEKRGGGGEERPTLTICVPCLTLSPRNVCQGKKEREGATKSAYRV